MQCGLPLDVAIIERLVQITVNSFFNVEDFYIDDDDLQSETTPSERSQLKKCFTQKALFLDVLKIRSKVLAVWKAFQSVKAVAKLSPFDNFMPWTRLFFARCVTLKGSTEYLKQVKVISSSNYIKVVGWVRLG